jgi:hypothetical protein
MDGYTHPPGQEGAKGDHTIADDRFFQDKPYKRQQRQ